MNIESNRRIEVARSEEEMYEKLELLQTQGYAESDIHVISKENAHLNTLNRHSEVSTHEAGTFMDTFKSWFTGESAVKEGLRKLDLNEVETERYAQEVAGGSIILYTELLTHADDPIHGFNENKLEKDYTDTIGTDVVQNRFMEKEEPMSDYAKVNGFTPSTNELVNETDGRLDEPQDRFARGETFATDPYLTRDEKHIGHSMQEDKDIQSKRPTIDERITVEENAYGNQSPGADPNLGPAAFGNNEIEDEKELTPEQYEERLERQKKLEAKVPTQRLY